MDDFTKYDIKPEGFINYLRYYGEHFNKKLSDFINKEFFNYSYSKELLEELFDNHKIELENARLYDCVVVANWVKLMFYGSSIEDEKHFVLFIRDLFKNEGKLIFNTWYAAMAKKGIPIYWEDMI